MPSSKDKGVRDPESWDYRECASCGWKTMKGAKFVRECRECGSMALIKKQRPLLVKKKKKAPLWRQRVKPAKGQMDLFDKTKQANEET